MAKQAEDLALSDGDYDNTYDRATIAEPRRGTIREARRLLQVEFKTPFAGLPRQHESSACGRLYNESRAASQTNAGGAQDNEVEEGDAGAGAVRVAASRGRARG